ncbi:Protein Y71H2AM.13 [Aphelenchoides avenae]|nr:Protein Y71H2AM.13 [Aphelenchus avenae]
MVFIHGGAFVADSAIKYGDIGICTNLVGAHAVVVVTIQYRLGYLGFFSTGDDACDDNIGLWDMTMALQWVKEEICNFGGDPDNVTVFGQSAGGASVDLLAMSPESRDPQDRANKTIVDRALAELYSDLFLGIGTQACVLDQLEAGTSEVFLYSFDYCNPKSFGLLGFKMPFKAATHCTELGYLFGVGILQDFTYNDDDRRMMELTTRLWTNFAKYGNPNGDPDDHESTIPFEWLPATKEHPSRYLSIKMEPEMKEKFHSGRPQFWLSLKRN